MMIIWILELLPTLIVTSLSTSLCLFCNSCFELLLLATEPVSNAEEFAINTSKVHINNMYIIYTFAHFAILLIRQVFGAVPLPATISFAAEALSFRLRSRLGFFTWAATCLPFFLKFPFPPFVPLLETSGFVYHQHLMLFLDFYHRRFQHREELGNRFRYPLHIIVHHGVLVTWW